MNISMNLNEKEQKLIFNQDLAFVSMKEIQKSALFLKSILSDEDYIKLRTEYNIDYTPVEIW